MSFSPHEYDFINFFDKSMLEEWIEAWSMPSKEDSEVYPLFLIKKYYTVCCLTMKRGHEYILNRP